MKLFIKMACLGILVSTSVSYGQLAINWIDNSGVTQADGTTPWLDGGGTGVAQLLYTPSGVISDALPTGPSGDNVIWDSGTVTLASAGNPYGATFSFLYNNPVFTAGSVFIRVFEADANPLTPGTQYFTGQLYALIDNPEPAQEVNIGAISSGTGDLGTWQLNQTVIPEPSVFAMLGLGGLFLMIRRRFINS